MAPKVDLAASWAPFGQGLGRSWGSFGSSWALPGRFFGVWKRPLIKHWSTMGSKRPSSSILEPPGLDFGAPGPRFWSLWASIFKLPGLVLPSLGCSCFLLLSLAFSCLLLLSLPCSCLLLLSLAFSCLLLLSLPCSCFLLLSLLLWLRFPFHCCSGSASLGKLFRFCSLLWHFLADFFRFLGASS